MFFALALFGWTAVSAVEGLVIERELVEREVAGRYYRLVTGWRVGVSKEQ
jgi:hypothetical protein